MHFEKVVLSVLYVLLFACWSLQAQATHGGNTEVRTKGINLVQTLLNAKTISPIKPAESLVDTSFTQQGQQQRLSSFAKRYVTTEPVEEVNVTPSSWWDTALSVAGGVARVFVQPFVKIFQTISEWLGLEELVTTKLPEFVLTYLPIDSIASLLSPGDWTDWNSYPQ